MARTIGYLILFLFYAAFVWYFCFRYRRQWLGYLSILAGVAIVGLLAQLHHIFHNWLRTRGGGFSDASNDGRLFDLMLAVEAVIVFVVGVFFVVLPRHVATRPCRKCKYELAGHEEENPRCPECGLEHAFAKVKPRPCATCGKVSLLTAQQHECSACRAKEHISQSLSLPAERLE